MKNKFLIILALLIHSISQGQPIQSKILITNVQVFNGIDNKLVKTNVLIEGSIISKIDTFFSNVTSNDITIIDGTGKYLMPGLIDAHVHLILENLPAPAIHTADIGFMNLLASYYAEKQLMRGFTSVRDMGGNVFSLAKSIDMGLVKGPRVFPSGAAISQTGGHGDFDLPTSVPNDGELSYLSKTGMTAIADGYDEVLKQTRVQLRQGATQIKLCAGGGIISMYDPIDVSQYTEQEIRAAVEAAENWGTYVTVHAYNNTSVRRAISAGVKCIEHAQLINDTTAKLMADKKVWWSLQPFLNDNDVTPYPEGSSNWKKQMEVINGTDNAYKMAKKYKIKVAFGTDHLFDSSTVGNQGHILTKLTRWYTPFEILKMATHDNAELLSMCGERNPYPLGKLGEISVGAYADLIILDGNPLENINLLENPTDHFKLIMKNGVIYKNELTQ
jgi:imidazolonepropionase-like amidohydrolase